MVLGSDGTCVHRIDYLPFGGEAPRTEPCYGGDPPTNPSNVPLKFTGKERDVETGLDFFESRYFSAAQGRFTSPDVMMGKPEWLADSQRWNRYAYVRNNPLKYMDPNGEDLIIYTYYGNDLIEEQKTYLQANIAQIHAAIAAKFKDAGVGRVEFRDGAKLTQKQIGKILANGRNTKTTGIGLLNFSNEKFSGYQSNESTFGSTARDSRSVVFMKQIGAGLDLSQTNDAEIMNFRMGEVGAHELGHGQGFTSDTPSINFIKELFGGGNLMGEGQEIPTRPKQFDRSQSRTQRAIKEINRIGDSTPKP